MQSSAVKAADIEFDTLKGLEKKIFAVLPNAELQFHFVTVTF